MENSVVPVTRKAKVKFVGDNEVLVGTVIYSATQTEMGVDEVRISNFRFKPHDSSQPERLYDFWKVDMVIFL
jgi:hypothetical protein